MKNITPGKNTGITMKKSIITELLCLLLLFFLQFTGAAFAGQKTDGSIVSRKYMGKKGKVKIFNITYYSDGLKVKGLMYIPPAKKGTKLPVVIFNHDGMSGISESHEKSSLRIANKGYAVFCPAYRGEPTSYRDRKKPKEKRDRSEGELEVAKGEVNDVLNAIKVMSNFKWVNKKKIALAGASHGALISLIAASKNHSVRAVICAYGVMDIYKWYKYLKDNNKLGKDKITIKTYGNGPRDKPRNFAVRNGISYVKNIKCPVLILQGAKDTIVPQEQAFYAAEALKKTKVKWEVIIYSHCLHGFLIYVPYLKKVDKLEKQQTELAWQRFFRFLKTNMR
ncbi:MAG: dienelactone hydrolase family protein [Candidatus Eremiobacteraeota bacterium]|nr:dienelactone hydrolase family protein [Candidatus Eremiobacteraeota bacterium]